MRLAIHQFPYNDDNYGVLLHDAERGETALVDAGDADAAIDPLSIPEVRAAVQRASFELLVGFQLTQEQLEYNVRR